MIILKAYLKYWPDSPYSDSSRLQLRIGRKSTRS